MNIIRILVPNFVVFIISLLTYLNLCAIKAKTSHQGSQETQLIPGNPGQSATFLGETQPQITDATLETKSRWNKFLFLFTLVGSLELKMGCMGIFVIFVNVNAIKIYDGEFDTSFIVLVIGSVD